MGTWTVTREIDQPIRHRCFTSSGGDYLADLTLRLSPDLDLIGVEFCNILTEPPAVDYAADVELGIREFANRRAKDLRPIGYLRVTLLEMPISLVDAKPHRFKEAALMAMTAAFEAAEIEI